MDAALRKMVLDASVQAEARGAPREIVATLEDALVVLAMDSDEVRSDPGRVAEQVTRALRRWEEWQAASVPAAGGAVRPLE